MLANRQKSILQYLIGHGKPVFGKEIAISLGISTRALRNEMQAIDSYLKPSNITVHSSPRSGYWIEEPDRTRLSQMGVESNTPNGLPVLPGWQFVW